MSEVIKLAHGAGGSIMDEFLSELILKSVTKRTVSDESIGLDSLDDGATISLKDCETELVVSTDGHTVDPIFFPGGDIGRLATSGTINDVAVMGGRPIAIASALIIEEGFPVSDLKKILQSMDEIAREVDVAIITGDTKVMPKGYIDKITVTTTGIGIVPKGRVITDSNLRPGDKIIATGTIGDHGIALLSFREGIEFETELKSDCAPIYEVIQSALAVGGVSCMKDPTRGGIASALNEFAQKSRVSIWIEEEKIPRRPEVLAASDMLGLDPLDVACEGVALIGVSSEKAERTLEQIRKTRYGKDAAIIGEARVENPGYVILETFVGGQRIIEKPVGELIPRVC